MNDELLIELVRQHPPLYDTHHIKYNDSDFKNNIWHTIGGQLEVDALICKTRWSNIRDNYKKYLKKLTIKTEKNVKPYKFADQLIFLTKYSEDIAKALEEKGGEATEENCVMSDEEHNPVIPAVELLNSSLFWKDGPNECGESYGKRKRTDSGPIDCANSTLMRYIISKIETEENPVDAFLAGLAPALKKLSPRQWHYAKGELFETVQKYELKNLMNNQHRQQ